MASVRALALLLLMGSVGAASTACTQEDGDASTDEGATDSSEVRVQPHVIVADSHAANVTEVLDGKLIIPLDAADKYQRLPPGTVFVGPRGGSKNPDGFLRKIASTNIEGPNVVFVTTPATLLDAIVDGNLKTSSGSVSLDGDHLSANKNLTSIDLDFSGQPLVDNVETITTAVGETKFFESITIDKGFLKSRPGVDVDLRIKEGKVTRFMSKVEGSLDSSIIATSRVTAEGPVNEEVLAALRGKRHQVKKTLYQSKRLPLPTFAVGRIPVSPAAQFTVSLTCDIGFGGPMKAVSGVEAKSYVRLAGIFERGDWAPPSTSEFDIKPAFELEHAGALDARCAIEMDAELTAYGVGGVTMTIAPYLDFEVERGPLGTSANKVAPPYLWTVQAGATGAMKVRADVFGVPMLDRSLVDWKAPAPITGSR